MAASKYIRATVLLLTTLCAGSGFAVYNEDPMEDLNRNLYETNRVIDGMYIKPVTRAYEKVLPLPAKMSVSNFVSNLGDVPVAANGILQGKFDQGLRDLVRFGVNSTLGLLGIFDVASEIGLEQHTEDFGKTMYKWGWKKSAYFVIPVLGPSTFRDAVGIVGNLFLSPSSYFKPKWRNRYYVMALVNRRSHASEFEGVVNVAGVNNYNLVRSGYLQNRAFVLSDGKISAQTNTGTDVMGEPPA